MGTFDVPLIMNTQSVNPVNGLHILKAFKKPLYSYWDADEQYYLIPAQAVATITQKESLIFENDIHFISVITQHQPYLQ